MGVVTALWVAVWWCLLAPRSSNLVTCSVISSCGSQPLWVLCFVHCLVYLALGWVRFWPAVSTAPVRCGVCSLGCPSCLVLLLTLFVLHLLLHWGGLVTGLWPLLLLLCVGLLWGSLLRRSVALGSCAPYPVGSSLADSYGLVVHALGVFLDSFLGFFPLTSSCYGWLGVVLACISCGAPYLWLVLCSSACVSSGGCPSFSQVGPAHSHWLPLLWTWCACGLQLFTSPMYTFGMWSPFGSGVSFCHS